MQTNLDAAKQTLVGHELTLTETYDKAYELLEKPEGDAQLPFEVVLCDLLMPAGAEAQGAEGEKFIGQEMPVGFALALMAVLHGAKYVAVVTNQNHHQHPAAALLDRLGSDGLDDYKEDFVKIRANGVPIGFVNFAPMIGVDGTSCKECEGTGKHLKEDHCSCISGMVRGKDWGRVLQVLLEN